MKKVILMVIAAMAFLVLTTGAYAQGAGPANKVTINLMEENGSGQTGTATLTSMDGGKTMVVLQFTNGSSTAQPAHIHKGSCANLDPKPAYPLTSPVNGASSTVVDTSLDDLVNEPYAINVHKSPTEASVYTACGDIVNMQLGGGAGGGQPGGMPSTGNPDQTLLLIAFIALSFTFTGTGLRFARRKS